ncbi:hypothetical protein Peur_060383 [Populus x canadensis]
MQLLLTSSSKECVPLPFRTLCQVTCDGVIHAGNNKLSRIDDTFLILHLHYTLSLSPLLIHKISNLILSLNFTGNAPQSSPSFFPFSLCRRLLAILFKSIPCLFHTSFPQSSY